MPLYSLNHDKLRCLYDKIFDPFCDVEGNFDPVVHQKFEDIRSDCKYYTFVDTKDTTCNIDMNAENLSILHLNVRSILNNEKFDAFKTFLHLTGIHWDVVCVSESWLNSDVEKFRHIEGYTAFFEHRLERTGGGVAVYIRNNSVTSCDRLQIKSPTGSESIFIQCNLPLSKVIIGQIYRPPNTCPALFIEEFSGILELISRTSSYTCIAGDFNFDLFHMFADANVNAFFHLLLSHGFLPSISLATRQSDEKVSLLDNIYCNNVDSTDGSGLIYDDLSDHFPVFQTLKVKKPYPKEKRTATKSFNYRKVNELKSHLQSELQSLRQVVDPNVACTKIIQAYSTGIEKFSYLHKPTRKDTPIKPWITPGILVSINRKNKLFILKNNFPTQANISNYCYYRNRLVTVIREAKKQYIGSELKNANHKETWKILRELSKGSTHNESMPDTFKNNDTLVKGAEDIAENFNRFFTSIGKKLKKDIGNSNINPLNYIPSFVGSPLSSLVDTSKEEVQNIIENMNNVGGGYDKINTRIFKATYKSILAEIVHLMNLCLQSGTFPNLLKQAVVKPIFKAGDKHYFNNYRPISLLPVISKLLEKLIYYRLHKHLDMHDILNERQFGFRKGMSTYMPLLLLQDKITTAFESNKIVCGLYLDLRKAFDTVDINILLSKIQHYGVKHDAYNMLHSYLTDRMQCVQVDSEVSGFLKVETGVPQGSILGPLLFIIYINDLPIVCNPNTSYLYADDTAIFIEGKDENEVQRTIDILLPKMEDWFVANQLSLNTDKTYYQIYTNKKMEETISLNLYGANIKRAESVKYLGVFIDDDLKWHTHLSKLHTILCRNVGIMSKVRYFLDSSHLRLLYNSLFLSHINYCCLIFSNTFSSHLSEIEKLQKRAIRLIDGQPWLAHSSPIFKKLKLLKIKDIGNQQMLLLMHKKIRNELPGLISELFVNAVPGRNTRNIKHFDEPFTYKLYKTHTASWLGPRLWNNVMVPSFPLVQTVPITKYSIKQITKQFFLNQY